MAGVLALEIQHHLELFVRNKTQIDKDLANPTHRHT